MSGQREHQVPGSDGSGAAGISDDGAAARLATAREQAERVFAAADAIMGRLRQGDAQRFLDQARQTGGQ